MSRTLPELLLEEGLDDWVPLASVDAFARDFGDERVMERSLAAIRELVEQGLVILGTVTKSGFTPWTESLDSSLARIETAWRTQTWDEWGFICWLSNTDRGNEAARAST